MPLAELAPRIRTRTAQRKLALLVGGASIGALIAWLLAELGVEAAVHGTVAPAVATAPPLIDEFLLERQSTKQDRVADLIAGQVRSGPLREIMLITLSLLFLERLILVVMACALALLLLLSAGAGAVRLDQIIGLTYIGSYFAFVVLSAVAAFLGRHAMHRLGGRAPLWILVSLATYLLIDAALVILVFNLGDIPLSGGVLAKLLLAAFGLLALGFLIGIWIAVRERSSYLMTRLFRKLSQGDQQYLIELAKTAPGVQTPSSEA
jgi:hypothetical protein